MIDHRPAIVLSTVNDPERRKMLTLMAASIEPPARTTLALEDAAVAGLAVLAAIVLLLLAV